jgi:hypothetical protein
MSIVLSLLSLVSIVLSFSSLLRAPIVFLLRNGGSRHWKISEKVVVLVARLLIDSVRSTSYPVAMEVLAPLSDPLTCVTHLLLTLET